MKKTYLLDTSVLVHSPYSLFSFGENNISVADATLESLDKVAERIGENGVNAKKAIDIIDSFRALGDISKGVKIESGGIFRIETNYLSEKLPETWDKTPSSENRILKIAKGMTAKEPGSVILVSNKSLLRIKADLIGVETEEFGNDKMAKMNEEYTGRIVLQCSSDALNTFFNTGKLDPKNCSFWDEKHNEYKDADLVMNEYCVLKSNNASGLGRFNGKEIVSLGDTPSDIKAKNVGQKFAMDALFAPASEVPLVILKGPAGTGKTFLALAAALDGVLGSSSYEEVLISRPNVKFDETVGLLKGGEVEKIGPLMRPIMDNLRILTRTHADDTPNIPYRKGRGNKRGGPVIEDDDKFDAPNNFSQYLFDNKMIYCEAMEYMRGRSIPNTFIIIDEAQNMSPLQAFGIASRLSSDAKVILTGDPNQIDANYLDSRNNGLTFASETMKGSPLCRQITFDDTESVRSPLALEVIKRMGPLV